MKEHTWVREDGYTFHMEQHPSDDRRVVISCEKGGKSAAIPLTKTLVNSQKLAWHEIEQFLEYRVRIQL